MKPTPSAHSLERKIEILRQELLALGPIHPGSISEQYHVCGNPNCCCMASKKPLRHGPYHKLAFVHRGHPVCRFVRPDCLDELKERLANYKKFRQLIDQWIAASIEQGKIQFFPKAAKGRQNQK